MEKLRLNDASFFFEPESSTALGFRLSLRLPRPAAYGDHPGAASNVKLNLDLITNCTRRALPSDDDRR
jgi:hypothetical protein